jgi:proteic killer suppression protein
MIQSFANRGTEDVHYGRPTKAARRVCPEFLWPVAAVKLDQLDAADELRDLRVPLGNRLEVLRADRQGQHSIRVNAQYRICFRWTDRGPSDVEIVDYH